MTESNRKLEIAKIIFAVVVSGLLTIAIAIALLPFIFSTSPGNKFVTEIINSKIPGKVYFESLSTSWKGPQLIKGLQLFDKEGKEIANVQSIEIQSSLWNVAEHSFKNADYIVQGLKADIIQDANGETNIAKALQESTTLTTENLNIPPLHVLLSDVNATIYLSQHKDHRLKISGKSMQDGLQGDFNANLNLSNEITGSLSITNFPVAILDEAISYSDKRLKGLFLKILGNNLNLKIEQKDQKDGINLQLKSPTTIAKIIASLENNHIHFQLDGSHKQFDEAAFPFKIDGKLNNPLKTNGDFDTDHLVFSVDGQFENFPVKLLNPYLNMGSDVARRIAVLIGDKINGTLKAELNDLKGPVVINVTGSNGSVSLDATLHENHLSLNKDFEAKVKLTKEFGEVILDEIFPLASGLIGSSNPLTIIVNAPNFSLPIKNFSIKDIHMEKASLNLGKVFFRNDASFGTIFSLFNKNRGSDIEVWFTPLYMSMQNGVINLERIDMLVMNNYPIATWGTVNFVKDRVNMMIGLTSQSLLQGFNLQNLTSDYLLQIPFQGPISNPSIDRKKAMAKIAAMVASNRGPEGVLIGTVLQIVSGEFQEEPAPKPTTNPLPWVTGGVENAAPEAKEQKNKKSKNNPIHQVEEKATSILKNIVNF